MQHSRTSSILKRSRSLQFARYSALLAAAAVSTGAAHAQFRASIQGTVTDSTGAVIPGASIALTDNDTGKVITATSNGSGVYNFNGLAPDHYTLSATLAGFQKKVVSDVILNPDQVNGINLTLAIDAASTTVNVSADSVQAIETGTANISGNIDANQIQHLPSAGRDVFQLIQLAPGVFGDGAQSTGGTQNLPGSQGPGGSSHSGGVFSTENGPQANANGGQYETNSVSIDGISTVSAVWGGTSIITPSEDSVGNVKVLSNGYDAENGRFSGAQVQVSSKTGTNQFHGSLFFRANRPGLNAYQRYNGSSTFNPITATNLTAAQRGLQRDTTKTNQYGGSIGGPIIKNRLFAFFNY